MYTAAMTKVAWKFDALLEAHNVTPAQLQREIIRQGYDFGAKSIYRFTGDGPANVNRGSLEAIIAGLRGVTKTDINVQDLLEYR